MTKAFCHWDMGVVFPLATRTMETWCLKKMDGPTRGTAVFHKAKFGPKSKTILGNEIPCTTLTLKWFEAEFEFLNILVSTNLLRK